jgi:hypothetical protein
MKRDESGSLCKRLLWLFRGRTYQHKAAKKRRYPKDNKYF